MSDTDIALIHDLVRRWTEAMRSADTAAIASMVTDDCVFMAPGSPTIQGSYALLDALKTSFATYHIDTRFDVQELIVTEEWAICRAVDEATITDRMKGDHALFSGWGLSILRKVNGEWRFARGMNTRVPTLPHPQ